MPTKEQIAENKRKRLERERAERAKKTAAKEEAKRDPYRPNTFFENLQAAPRVPLQRPPVQAEARDATGIGFSGLTEEEKIARVQQTGQTGAELEQAEAAKLGVPEIIRNQDTEEISGITRIDGTTTLGIDAREARAIAMNELEPRIAPLGTAEAGTAQAQGSQQSINQSLAGQVGQVGPDGELTPFSADPNEALIQGAVGSIPSAVRTGGFIAAGALLGAKTGAIGGAAAGPLGIAIGAAVGLGAGVIAGAISNINAQRGDNAQALQRRLDEGKQNMAAMVTMARSDPSNKLLYLREFNNQAQTIRNSYRQLQLDVNTDVLKFETAVPNLAEFNTFYNAGGEFTELSLDMQAAIRTPADVNYDMMNMLFKQNERGAL